MIHVDRTHDLFIIRVKKMSTRTKVVGNIIFLKSTIVDRRSYIIYSFINLRMNYFAFFVFLILDLQHM